MKIDIETLIAAAVTLDREEEDLCGWEIEAETLALDIAEAGPAQLGEHGQNLAALRINARALADECALVRQAIEAQDTPDIHPDVRPTVSRMQARSARLEHRMTRLLLRLVDAEKHLGETLRAMAGEGLDAALVRLLANRDAPTGDADMVALVAQDQIDIEVAMASWRRLHGDHSPQPRRAPPRRADIVRALLRLESEGLAIRHPRTPLRPRWVLKARRRAQVPAATASEQAAPLAPSADAFSDWACEPASEQASDQAPQTSTAPFWHALRNSINNP